MDLNKNVILDLFKDDQKNKELLHDINLKLIPTKIHHNIWKVDYSYKTIRGNKKENYKYVISEDGENTRIDFINYINEFNRENQHRLILNVKILNVSYVGKMQQSY